MKIEHEILVTSKNGTMLSILQTITKWWFFKKSRIINVYVDNGLARFLYDYSEGVIRNSHGK